MLNKLYLKPLYITTEDDFAKDFYTPCMLESIRFDRIACYFSSKALAAYSAGIESYYNRNAKYRLIISKEISEEDFEDIREGYKLKKEIIDNLITSLDEKLSLLEEKNISNFAFLLALGVIDLKFAFCATGLFHDKSGIFFDEANNCLIFYGSNNETDSGLSKNYEKFVVIPSWIKSDDFYNSAITKSIEEFNALWANKHESIIVMNPEEVIINKILSFNKGKIIYDEALLTNNAIIADYENSFILQFNNIPLDSFINSGFYKINIKNKVEKITGNCIYFIKKLSYLRINEILNKLSLHFARSNITFLKTKRLQDFLERKNLHIEERRKIGINIKHLDKSILEQYEEYKRIVDKELDRPLRDKQMRDSFFMATMKKSANFSVPGSGKTSAALGTYAFYNAKGYVNKMIVIGPKNSFESWKIEFHNTFGNKKELNYFDEHELVNYNTKKILKLLQYNSADKNLFLFNYEALSKYEGVLESLIDEKTLLIFDEVHKIKRIGGEYASHALRIAANASYVIAMTGTPIPNSYSDIYNMLHLMFPDEYDDFFRFDTQFLDKPTEDELETINNALYPFFCRTSKKELGVPNPNEDIFYNDNVTKEEQQLFEILSKKYHNNKLALFIRILQLESNPRMLLNTLSYDDFSEILDIDIEDIDSADYVDYSDDIKNLINSISLTTKKKKALEKIESILKKDKKLILWCIFVDSINSFNNILSNMGYKVAIIYGAIPSIDRNKILEEFKNGKYDILITNPHTLAESVSLHNVCHDAYYFEYSYNLVHLLQSKDRIHRLGLPDTQYTQYYYSEVTFKNFDTQEDYSLDSKVYERLKQKEQIMLDAIDNNSLEPVTTSQEDLDIIFHDLFK